MSFKVIPTDFFRTASVPGAKILLLIARTGALRLLHTATSIVILNHGWITSNRKTTCTISRLIGT